MTRVYLALGGNLGSVEQSFSFAIERLALLPETSVISSSSVFRTEAVGSQAGSEFRNAAACIDTSLQPLELLTHLQRIEDQFGRVRDIRWGPRPLDLDVVFYGDQIIHIPRLTVPHPACWYRRFVLDPLNEIAPSQVHPEKGISVRELRERLLVRPLTVAVAGTGESDRSELMAQLSAEFPEVSFSLNWSPTPTKTKSPGQPAILFWLDSGTESAREFDQLPVVPRLEVSATGSGREEFVRDVLRSALGR